MLLTIIYDNEILPGVEDVENEWGFSCLIDTEKDKVLFDTGGDGEKLLSNMETLGIDPSSIDKIVISHEHWDHNGGLDDLYEKMDDVTIYDLADREVPRNMEHVKINGSQTISEDIMTTGRLNGDPIDEQSLVLQGKEGLWVLTGCSHPGVQEILRRSSKIGRIMGLIGGFHGLEDLSILEGLDFIYPMHCTVKKDEILHKYPDTARGGGIGLELLI